MDILFVSTLKRRIGPDVVASRSRIIYELSCRLAEKGHKVSILGTADSAVPNVKVIPIIEKGWVDLPSVENPFYRETAYLVKLAKKIEEIALGFDIIHNHTYPEFINLMVLDKIRTPMITTVHAQATEELDNVLSLFPKTTLVALSNAHKKLFKKAIINEVVYNGINTNLYAFSKNQGDYLLWLGRLSKSKDKNGEFLDPKGVKWAIELAKKTGEKLLLSGNVEDMDFYNRDVKPYLSEKIQWVGPVSSEQMLKREQVVGLMQGAKAYLMTINWEEPFGLVMVEAMSCGTPVIAFNRGSVPEIVVNGLTGYVIDYNSGIDGLTEAFDKLNSLSEEEYRRMRLACRKHVEENFSIEQMVNNYEKLYIRIIEGGKNGRNG